MYNRSRHLIVGIVIASAAISPIAARASFTCSTAGSTLTISGGIGDDSILVGVDGGDILVGPNFYDVITCGSSSTIDQIQILPAEGNDHVSLFDPATFAPGASAEATGTTEIEVNLDGGAGTNSVDLFGDMSPFTLIAGTLGANWNGDDDIDFTFTNVQSLGVLGSAATNIIDLRGSTLTGSPLSLPAEIFGGPLADQLFGGAGNDVVEGMAGNDTMNGGGGINRLMEMGNTNFTITNSVVTGNGTDAISMFQRATIMGGIGNNTVRNNGFSGNVTFEGGLGNDTLIGGIGADRLDGGPGNDILTGNRGNDALIGGTGTDGILASGNVNMTLRYNQVTGNGTDSLSGIETARLTGGASANTISASAFTGRVTIFGGGGNDTLTGGSANDTLRGGAGNDRLYGLAGNDSLGGEIGTDFCDGGYGTGDTKAGCESFTRIP